eukprot:CAMPEP_0197545888 /NCGR_PEP_ID=MMETSP1320-20131121/744_1 /TAXON_ID=91990 /ORGANISM="Bolidomonas sp., Strain RCC2347" /LENGTH=399 /DNA_ID=CAMNT_0043105429 /DNA_START=248 /DNA_END=1444 /DNA_ORIENTATION=+
MSPYPFYGDDTSDEDTKCSSSRPTQTSPVTSPLSSSTSSSSSSASSSASSTSSALARFKATARATTLALTNELSLSNNREAKMSREEAADLITNSLVDAVDGGMEGERGAEVVGEGGDDVSATTDGGGGRGPGSPPMQPQGTPPSSKQAAYGPSTPVDPRAPSQISALLSMQPELTESEAARALAVSHAVKVIRAKRGCSAAEAIDELSCIMTEVCKVTRRGGGASSAKSSPARPRPTHSSPGRPSPASAPAAPARVVYLTSPPVIKKRAKPPSASFSPAFPLLPPQSSLQSKKSRSISESSSSDTSVKDDDADNDDDDQGFVPGGRLSESLRSHHHDQSSLQKMKRRVAKKARPLSPHRVVSVPRPLGHKRVGDEGGRGMMARSPKKRTRTAGGSDEE